MTIGEATTLARQRIGMSRKELAEISGYTYANIRNIELDLTTPRLDTVIDLADVFGLSVDEYIGHITKESRKKNIFEPIKPYKYKTLFNAVNYYGARNQEDIAIEEMAELTKALIKHRRYKTTGTKANILEEMVDAYIMLMQLVIIHGWDEKIVDKKIDRLEQRMKEGAENG